MFLVAGCPMNRIYKVIYSKARQCYIVVSELAKSNHKSSQQGADHTNTPALARIIAVALAAGALTWGSVPGVSWAAETAANKAGAGIGIAIGEKRKTDDFAKKQIAIGVGATDKTDGSAPNDASIALGAGAHTYNELGRRAATISFGKNTKDYTGGIAIGLDTYAIVGETSIGQRDYNGKMGDITVSDENRETLQYAPGATSLGSNAYAGGTLATVIGAYNISSSGYNGTGGINSAEYVAQNLGSTILGTLNTNESTQASDVGLDYDFSTGKAIIKSSSSGIANSIIGVANAVKNSNGSIVLGAGNTVSNSSTKIVDDITGSLSELINWQPTSYQSVNDMAQDLRDKVKSSKSGGSTLVIGGGNTADYTQRTQIIGVNNTVTGTEETPSDYNMVNAFETTVKNSSHLYTIGTNNKITNTKNTIIAGDDYTNVSGLTDSVIIGNNRVTGDEKAAFASFKNQKNIVSIGNKNILDNMNGSISIGNNNFMWNSNGWGQDEKPEEYDTGNVAIGNNTYINSSLNQENSIVIGKNATVRNMAGTLEQAFAFGTPRGKDYSGSIAIGQNSYARSGSTMIGIHNYQGKLGDLDIAFAKDEDDPSGIANYQESIDATTIGNNSYNNGVFSTVVGSYTAVSGLYHNQKWGEKPYGVQNFGAAVLGSLNSVEGLTSTEHNTAGMADSILGSANRTKNANGTIMVGAGNVVEDSINDFDVSGIKTKDGIASPNALSDAMRTSIKSANGGGAAAVVGNGNEVKKSTNVAVVGSKNSVTSTTNSQIFGDNRIVTGADGAPIDGAVIIGSANQKAPLTTNKKNVTILGYNANATIDGGVALGAGSVASVDNASKDANAIGYDPATKKPSTVDSSTWKSTAAAVSVGDASKNITRQITNVAAGTQDTDAVNVAQLKKAMETAQASANDTDKHVQAGTYAVTTVQDTAGKDTQGVALELVDKDGNKVGDVITITDVAKASDVGDVSKLSKEVQNTKGSTTVVDAINNVNTKVNTVDNKVGDLNYSSTNYVKSGDNVTTSISNLDKAIHDATTEAGKHSTVSAGNNIKVTPDTTDGKTDYKVSLSDDINVNSVTAKTVTTDNLTVNKSATIGKVTINADDKGTISGLTNKTWDAKNITSGQAATEDQLQAATKNAVNYDDDTSKTITLREDTTIKNVANTSIEQGSKNAVNAGTVYNETRVKQDGKYVKVSNTAGENLSALDNQVASNSSNITNLNGRVNSLDSKVNKVGAGAAALAALHPLDFDPDDKWDFAVGYGNYRDANSVAVGAFYRPDDDTMFSVGTNFGNGENMINAGVSFKFGPKGKSQVRPGSTQEITELRATVARQDDQLKKQDSEIKELKAMVQQLLAAQDKKAATK